MNTRFSSLSLASPLRRSTSLWTTALAALLGLAVALPAQASLGPDRALSNSGDMIRVTTGTYAELFPEGGDDVDPAYKVLALDFERADGLERLLVPATADWRPERHPTLVYDSRNDAVMLFWVAGAADGTWSMELTSFRDGEWLERSNVKANNTAVFIEDLPQVVVTTDDFFLDLGEDTPPLESRRTTFHVVWHEQDDVRYAPVSFLDGAFVGWSEAVSLSRLVFEAHQGPASGDPLPPGFLPENLAGALGLSAAVDPHAISVQLTDTATGRLATLRIEETPMSLAHIAERVREQIGAQAGNYQPGDLGALADYIRSDIIFIGAKCRLHPTVGRFLADEITGWILTHGEDYGADLDALSRDAWRQALDAGSSIYAKTLGSADVADDPLLELTDPNGTLPHLAKVKELVRVTLPASFEAPLVGEGETFVYTSADNRSMLVAWKGAEAEVLHYVENLGWGWSEPRSLALGEQLTEAAAHALLQRKIR